MYPNPEAFIWDASKPMIVNSCPRFPYLFIPFLGRWAILEANKKHIRFGPASTTSHHIPSHPSHFKRVFPPASPVFFRHDLPRRRGGRLERHGFAAAELGQDAERRTQLRSDGTEVLQRLGAVRKGWGGMAGWDDFGGYNLIMMWMIMEDMFIYVHRFSLDMNVATVFNYGDIKWVIDWDMN